MRLTKKERIDALEIAKKHDIKVVNSWWSPFQNVQWQILKSKKVLSDLQYAYLSNNKFIEEKRIVKKGECAILTISDAGIAK